MNKCFPAQVSAVFDTTGLIHPQWCRFRNSDGELIKIESIIVEKRNSEFDRIHRNFLCYTCINGIKNRFCLCYNIRDHSWTLELRNNDRDYEYLVSHNRMDFT